MAFLKPIRTVNRMKWSLERVRLTAVNLVRTRVVANHHLRKRDFQSSRSILTSSRNGHLDPKAFNHFKCLPLATFPLTDGMKGAMFYFAENPIRPKCSRAVFLARIIDILQKVINLCGTCYASTPMFYKLVGLILGWIIDDGRNN